MSGFSADWLTLREPYDLRARNPAVLDAVTAFLEPLSSVRIVDLACGTGSTLRALSPHLPARQNWKLVDNDLGLLARATATPLAKHATVTAVPLDLNRDLEAALDGPVDLVTTSALLDLVSETWLDRLAVEIAARAIPLYAALSYDGRIALTPSDPLDAAIVNRGQRASAHRQGFRAGARTGGGRLRHRALRGARLFAWFTAQSDWALGPDDRDMQSEILTGWADAAHDIGALSLADTTAWLARRRDARCRRTLLTPRRSRRFLRNPERHALSRQIAVEQHVVPDLVHADRHPQRLIGALDRRQRSGQEPPRPA